ncbi:hypothetical protein AK812_SmicGene26678 [Symbiodinium microadriaticum]|uniref:Uncharacterized protein n=1 Tax=Symbiodinium microadriaticum TaxID=2951 RepID=A0A1Q9D8W0_SYMMI|nr:hypothetical protein AK812_SmicGene26678 [Symbiodinium microadriaticum]
MALSIWGLEPAPPMADKRKGDENTYVIHPEYKNKFRPGPTREIIRDVLQSKLDKEVSECWELAVVSPSVSRRAKESAWERGVSGTVTQTAMPQRCTATKASFASRQHTECTYTDSVSGLCTTSPSLRPGLARFTIRKQGFRV